VKVETNLRPQAGEQVLGEEQGVGGQAQQTAPLGQHVLGGGGRSLQLREPGRREPGGGGSGHGLWAQLSTVIHLRIQQAFQKLGL